MRPLQLHRAPIAVGAVLMAAASLLSLPAAAQNPAEVDQGQQFLELMGRYMAFSDQYVAMAGDSVRAFYLAIEGIAEIHQNRGEAAKAIPHLRRILEQTREQPKRNLLRLKIKDLLTEFGRTDEALEELEALIEENRA